MNNDQTGNVLVCVTRQKNCEKLIREGAVLAGSEGLGLQIVHVVQEGENILGNPQEGAALEHLFSLAKQYGAPMQMLRSMHVLEALADYARENHARWVVIGTGTGSNSFGEKLNSLLPETWIRTV